MAQYDPVVMTVNGQPVPRSEFEYSYNKNNSDGVIDKKTVEEYAELFINYKLKVQAALDRKMDTLALFNREYLQYRDQQLVPMYVTDADMENEAYKVYVNTKNRIGEKGLVKTSHILMRVPQDADDAKKNAAKARIDSIYGVLKAGGDFATLAQQFSQDPGSARNGGQLPWISVGQTLPEFEEHAFALKTGEMSQPFLSAAGYHIVKMDGRKELEPYDTLKSDIMKFLESRDARNQIANRNIDSIAASKRMKREALLDQKAAEVSAADPDMKYLFQEYHDGLLLYEVSNKEVWKKAADDTEGQKAYFNKNKSKYKWDEPRYKGIAYHTQTEADIDAVKKAVKGKPFDEWAEILRKTFNADSVIRIRVEKGIFKEGDNQLVDKMAFGKSDITPKPLKDYPYDAVYGKKISKPEDYSDVKGLVVADYQDELEKAWVKELRKKYPVTIDKDVLKTVNKH